MRCDNQNVLYSQVLEWETAHPTLAVKCHDWIQTPTSLGKITSHGFFPLCKLCNFSRFVYSHPITLNNFYNVIAMGLKAIL